MIRAIAVGGVLLLWAACPLFAQEPEAPAKKEVVERQALRALGAGQVKRLQTVAASIRALKPADRAQLPFRVRPDGVEFRFHGEFPADRLRRDILEYVISDPGHSHESLLVVRPAEQARLKKVGEALAALKKAGKRASLEYKLVWTEKTQARVEDLQDIVGGLSDASRKAFLNQLGVNQFGLGGTMNVKADSAFLPSRRTSAAVLLIIRLH
jgi:hypothetical protein